MPIFCLLILFLLLILAGCWFAYSKCFHSPVSRRVTPDTPLEGAQYDAVSEHISRMTEIIRKIPCEEVIIKSHDGLNLYGRYYHLKDGAPVEILFHGYRSHPYRDCSGGHALSRKMGFNALIVDERAHGKSEGSTICFGIMERHDAASWVNYVNRRFGADIPIILSGLSMGAATVLMASNLNLPKNVVCIVADSPYSAPNAIIEKVCRDQNYPVSLCRPFIHLGAWLFGRFTISEITAKEAVAQTNIPILLIHGEADHFVPCSMSLEIANCCSSHVEVHTFPDAGHGLCYITDPRRYEQIIYDFFSRIPALKEAIDETFTKQLFRN